MVQHCHFKTHNTLNPFINRSTCNEGWAFSPQAAMSPGCTLTRGEKKSIDPSIEGVAGHSQSSHAHQRHMLCFRTRVSDELPESLRLSLALEIQMGDVRTNLNGEKMWTCVGSFRKRVLKLVNERRRRSFKEKGLEWKLTIQTRVLIMVKNDWGWREKKWACFQFRHSRWFLLSGIWPGVLACCRCCSAPTSANRASPGRLCTVWCWRGDCRFAASRHVLWPSSSCRRENNDQKWHLTHRHDFLRWPFKFLLTIPCQSPVWLLCLHNPGDFGLLIQGNPDSWAVKQPHGKQGSHLQRF